MPRDSAAAHRPASYLVGTAAAFPLFFRDRAKPINQLPFSPSAKFPKSGSSCESRVKAELRRRMHQPIPEQGKWLRQVVAGHFAYYAVPSNSRALSAFRHYVTDLWRRTLRRRSEKGGFTWERMTKLVADWLPPPRILHPWPDERFDVRHPR